MTSWFNFSSTVAPIEDTNSVSQISNLEETITILEESVNKFPIKMLQLKKKVLIF